MSRGVLESHLKAKNFNTTWLGIEERQRDTLRRLHNMDGISLSQCIGQPLGSIRECDNEMIVPADAKGVTNNRRCIMEEVNNKIIHKCKICPDVIYVAFINDVVLYRVQFSQ